MKTENKQTYSAPSIAVVDVNVEKGFQGSDVDVSAPDGNVHPASVLFDYSQAGEDY